jgi:hypothetical protein
MWLWQSARMVMMLRSFRHHLSDLFSESPRVPLGDPILHEYTTVNCRLTFHFRFVFAPNTGYRVYLDPALNDLYRKCHRAGGAHETHRLSDSSGSYICFSGRIETVSEAIAVAQLWAERTDRYLSSGTRF